VKRENLIEQELIQALERLEKSKGGQLFESGKDHVLEIEEDGDSYLSY